jgi:hypothetical protein
MQGKIKGRSTTVRAKPVCTWGGRGTRRKRSRAVTGQAGRGGSMRHHAAVMTANASVVFTP